MFQVEDLRPGRVQVWVEVGGVTVAEVVEDIQVLAGMHWLFTPPTWQHGSELSLEMLAAHVMPNAPEIADLLKDVSTRLEAASGSPSLEGYQGGPERVDQIVGAVYAALQAREIRYAEPPASWGVRGQKVRTPQEVLGDRIGTCLDLVVVMAACLEQSGIRPLLWVVEGHAFLGYWRVETALDAIAQVDVNDVVNRLDLGQMGLVETTSVTAGPTRTSFESACRSPYETHLAADLGRVLGVVDVWTARHAALFPLPARRRGTDGAIQVVEYRPAAHSAPPSSVLHESPGQASSTAPRLPVPPRVSPGARQSRVLGP